MVYCNIISIIIYDIHNNKIALPYNNDSYYKDGIIHCSIHVSATNIINNLKLIIMEILNWYKSLDINTKINFKDCFGELFSIKFSELSFLFSFIEKIEIGYNKLKIEGIIN